MATKINKQQDIIDYLNQYPCATEAQIWKHLGWGGNRDSTKKYADLVRRAYFSGKINRVNVKYKNTDRRKIYRYYVGNIDQFFK